MITGLHPASTNRISLEHASLPLLLDGKSTKFTRQRAELTPTMEDQAQLDRSSLRGSHADLEQMEREFMARGQKSSAQVIGGGDGPLTPRPPAAAPAAVLGAVVERQCAPSARRAAKSPSGSAKSLFAQRFDAKKPQISSSSSTSTQPHEPAARQAPSASDTPDAATCARNAEIVANMSSEERDEMLADIKRVFDPKTLKAFQQLGG